MGCNMSACVYCKCYQPFLTSSSLPHWFFFSTLFLFFFFFCRTAVLFVVWLLGYPVGCDGVAKAAPLHPPKQQQHLKSILSGGHEVILHRCLLQTLSCLRTASLGVSIHAKQCRFSPYFVAFFPFFFHLSLCIVLFLNHIV